MSAKKQKTTPARPAAPTEAAVAFRKTQPLLDKLRAEDVVGINVDVPRAVATALGALPALRALRPRIVEELPKHAVESLDNLEQYALAAWYAHLLAMPPASPTRPAKELLDEATKLREDLLVAAEALSHRGIAEPARVAEIRSGQGHIDVASDLVALAALFSDHWDVIQSKTAIERREIERAATLGPQLLIALGAREQETVTATSDAAEQRAKAFTVFVRAYDDCRRAVAYLTWKDDGSAELAPSLFRTRSGSRKPGADTSPTPETAAAAEPAPVA